MPIRFKEYPSQEKLRRRLLYDKHLGVFVWKEGKNMGEVAGSITKYGYVIIGVHNRTQFQAHRLAWIYMNGDIPEGMEVDHKDGDPGNNALHNLRLSTSSQQKMNKVVQSNNKAGLKGAYYHACRKGKKWRSQIKYGGVYEFLGYHETPEQAHNAYKEAAQRHYGDFCKY